MSDEVCDCKPKDRNTIRPAGGLLTASANVDDLQKAFELGQKLDETYSAIDRLHTREKHDKESKKYT